MTDPERIARILSEVTSEGPWLLTARDEEQRSSASASTPQTSPGFEGAKPWGIIYLTPVTNRIGGF